MKPPRRWLAFLLNLLLPPTGYVYAGAFGAAWILLAVQILGAGLAFGWTLRNPPGFYDRLPPQQMLLGLGWAVAFAIAAHAAVLAKRNKIPVTARRRWAAVGALLITASILLVLLRAFAPVSIYSVASSSMAPTLVKGDVVAVSGSRALCGHTTVQPGDLIIHRQKGNPNGPRYIKRVMATGGQSVQMRSGQLFVDGKAVPLTPTGHFFHSEWRGESPVLRETLSNGVSHETTDFGPDGEFDDTAVIRVPTGSVFVLGDNRDNSVDSRINGPVPLSDICGIAFKVLNAKDKSRIGTKP